MKLFSINVSFIFILLSLGLVARTQADNDVITNFPAADVNVGERLFLETRFSEYFYTNSGGDANLVVPGDPTVATLKTISGSVPGPFAGQAMNCRQCHLVDEEGYGDFGNQTLGNRTYADFTQRSPVPIRDDGLTQTPRNAMGLVDAFIPHNGPLLLHHDGQFASAHDLIIGTLTGRNYGWKPSEYAIAVHHIASIIRNDNGQGYLATMARGSRWEIEMPGETAYSNIFSGFINYSGSYLFDPRTLTADLISPQYRLDMRYANATDEQILDTIASLIEAYMRNLFFSQADNGLDFQGNGTPIFNGSPFDVFLIKNNLPQIPDVNETPRQYGQRLLQLVNQLTEPEYVTDPDDGHFDTQTQAFQFGTNELEGLKIFLRDKNFANQNNNASIGNCATCHSLPAFTDFIFHNTGASQEEYEAVNGTNTFERLVIPDYTTRQTNYDAYLPPTSNHPFATGIFETPPSTNQPGATDLGLWNVYGNPDFPAPQAGLSQILPQLLGLTTPQIASATVNGPQFDFNGSNGVPGSTYYVLASVDASLAMTNWDIIATNTFDSQGYFNFSSLISAATNQIFFRLSLQIPTPAEVLPQTLARFKTPTLRDLGQSDPYLHTGQMSTIEDVVQFYQQVSTQARLGQIRNGDPELSNISLDASAIVPLAAFLRSLNEDYTD